MPKRATLALLLTLLLGACAPGRAVESVAVLRDVAGGAHADAEELGPTEIAYEVDSRGRTADLYRPADAPPEAGLVLVPGATPKGKRDPRLVAFARELAAARLAVLVPALPGLTRLRLEAGHAAPVADAVRHLSERAGGGPVALTAISYAAGPAVLAALRPDLEERIGLILLVGPYHDMEAALTYVVTGAYRPAPDAPWQQGTPNPRGVWAFLAGNADRLERARDRRLLRRIAERKLRDPDADIADLARQLGPAGRSVHALVTADDPARIPALLADLPQAIRSELAALDLSRRDLARLPGTIRLLHGRSDPIVPFTESRQLAARLPAARTELVLVDGLLHADLDAVSWSDAASLLGLTYDILAWRDGAPEPDATGGSWSAELTGSPVAVGAGATSQSDDRTGHLRRAKCDAAVRR
jgi:pimeloyl-ACP methyl ester carboxylesterase